ncbi:MAG: hypothetical protein NWS22_01475 [Porticoccaceae bacterium]|jgi:hypothetical protein|nr:hypothetical protein [Alphaproteobacteria bacterium]MDP4743494.1 hypothetical protein [Porticoccaceae bacterium]MDP4752333.1 hypothetical protein [Porticoccaceae bacterium]MDP4890804.1 hypothetical protein [Porticoccaceae bacterium]MDP4987568.1 hypothetical protein [Porticoccaceae bacterium]
MNSDVRGESVVYGVIKNIAEQDVAQHRHHNRRAMEQLPSAESWSLVNREMFSLPEQQSIDLSLATEVMHFGASYIGVEHEWKYWLEQFEGLLRKMYWVSATVHLETEMSGVHSFVFATNGMGHKPNQSDIQIRCEWVKEAG